MGCNTGGCLEYIAGLGVLSETLRAAYAKETDPLAYRAPETLTDSQRALVTDAHNWTILADAWNSSHDMLFQACGSDCEGAVKEAEAFEEQLHLFSADFKKLTGKDSGVATSGSEKPSSVGSSGGGGGMGWILLGAAAVVGIVVAAN